MAGKFHSALSAGVILAAFALPGSGWAQTPIVTERYDNAVTGANLSESILNTSNVNVSQFGKLYSYAVDGSIQAQPLYVPNVTIAGQGTHNVLYVVTMNDVIYAFDADGNSVNGGLLWSVDFRNPAAVVTPIPITDIVGNNNLNIVGNVGIESTPVIDLSSNTMYLVARTKEVSGTATSYVPRLHAIDITNGNEKFGGPVVIQATNHVVFDPLHQNQRSSLVLVNGMVLFSWASHEDKNVWYGWIMAYNAKTLQQSSAFCTTPGDSAGGVWMSGRAPVVDDNGNVYYATGNGGWDGVSNFGDSVMKFGTTGGILTLIDYFTPDNYAMLASDDLDLGSSGPMLIPGTNLLIHGGKDSIFYLMRLSNLGQEQSGNNQIVQHFSTNGAEIHGGPVFWNRSSGLGPTMYVWPNDTNLKAYQFTGSTFIPSPISQSTIIAPTGSSGGVLTLSANGSTAGTGIVWSSMPLSQDGDHGTVQGVLRAFDANDLTTELWDSRINASRDDIGLWPKYSPPIVANGKVYMASFSNVLNVYGLLSTTPDFTIAISPSRQSVVPGGSTPYTVSVANLNGFAGNVNFTVTGLPTGATATFTPPSVTGSGSSTLTVQTSSSTPTGSATLTITGTSGSLVHTTAATLTVSSTGSGTGAISIKFVGNGTAMASTEVAGVVAKGNWNNASGVSNASPLELTDENGNATGAAVTWNADNPWVLPITDQAGNARMMRGYLDDKLGNATTVTVSGLPSNANGYAIYVYADGANVAATRTGNYQISGAGITTTSINLTDAANANFIGAFTQATASSAVGNYVQFTITATGFTLTVTPGAASDGTPRAPVNGIQIVPLGPATPDFTISSTTGTQTVTQGGSASYAVNVGALNGFSGSVNLSITGLPTGATATFTPPSVTGSGSSTLTVQTSSSTPTGSTTLTITGTSGTLVHTTTATLTVNSTVGSGTGAISIKFAGNGTAMASTEVAGVVAKGNWNNASGVSNGSSPLALTDENGNSTSAAVTWNADNPWVLPITDQAGNARMMRGYLDDKLGNATTVTISGLPSNANGYAIYVYADGDNAAATRTGNYQISGAGITTTSINLTDAANKNFSGAFTQATASSAVGNYVQFTITATGFTLTVTPGAASDSTPRAPVNGIQIVPLGPATPDFTISSTTGTQTVTQGGSASYAVNVGALNGFSGSVNLSITGLPTGATATFTPPSVTGSGSSTLTVQTSSSTPTGSTTLTITGTSGTLVHTTTATLTVNSAPDFTISTTTGTQTVTQGGSASYAVNVGALNGFSGSVNLSITGLPTGATATFTPPSVTGSGSSTLTVQTSSSTPTGSTTLTITGTSGTLVHTTTATLTVNSAPDFTISTTTGTQTVTQGGSASYAVNVGALNGFSGSVNLSITGLPTGATATFTPPSVTGSGSSTLTVQTSSSTPTGSTTLTITGTSGTLVHTTTATLTVNSAPDFTISTTTGTQTVTQGGSASYAVNVGALNGFSASVNLSITGLPTGATAAFTPPSVTGSGSSTLTVRTSSSTPTGSTTLTITGTSGTLVHTTTATLTVNSAPDFTISTTTGTQTVTQGGSASYAVNVGALNGFSASVNLSITGLPTGATAAFTPPSVTGSGSSTLTVQTSSSTPAGSTTLTITGTSGSLVHTTTATLTVNSAATPDFTISTTTGTQTVTQGGSVSYAVNVGALNGFSGSVNLSITGLPTGATATFTPPSVTGSGSSTLTVQTSSSTPTGSTTLTITGTSGTLVHTTTATLTVNSTVGSGTGAISIKFAGNGTAMASTEVAGVVAKGNWNNASGVSNGSSPLALTDENGNSTSAAVTWNADNPWVLPITDQAGNARMMRGYLDDKLGNATTVTVSGLPSNANGYAIYVYADGANVAATRTGNYQISGAGITTTSINLTDAANANFSGAFTQATASSAVGNYVQFTITATGFTLTVTPGAASDGTPRAPVNGIQIVPLGPATPDFTISSTTGTQTVTQGGSASYAVNVGALNGFSGSVNLSITGLPTGATATFTPPSVTGSGSSTLTVQTSSSTPTGSTTLTITGTSGTLVHTTTATLTVNSTVGSGTGAISIKFAGNGTAMASTEVAGVVAKGNWNNASGVSNGSSPLALTDENGNSTSAAVTWNADNPWVLPITDQAGNARMMRGYLDDKLGNATTVTISGLPSNANGYAIYVYADGDNAAATRTGNYQISGAGITTTSINLTDAANKNFSGAFTQATASSAVGNYVQFTITATGFTLTVTPGAASDSTPRAPVNGIQILPL